MSHPPHPHLAYQAYQITDVDRSHLNVLGICYWIWGAFLLLISLVSLLYIALGIAFVSGAMNSASQPSAPPPPPALGWLFVAMGMIFLLLGQLVGWLNVYVGFSLRRQRRWLLCNIVAGLNCLSIPFGTILGVFTFIVLARPAVKEQFRIKLI